MIILATLAAAGSAVASAADDIRDIRGPIVVPPGHPWWPYLAGAAAVAVITSIAFAVISRRRRPLSADVRALRSLEATRPLIVRGDAHTFSLQVSDAVRGYVEAAFELHAARLTTDELLADLMTDHSPVAAHRGELATFLGYCDLAKYARWSLSATDMTGMLASAETFVRVTAGAPS